MPAQVVIAELCEPRIGMDAVEDRPAIDGIYCPAALEHDPLQLAAGQIGDERLEERRASRGVARGGTCDPDLDGQRRDNGQRRPTPRRAFFDEVQGALPGAKHSARTATCRRDVARRQHDCEESESVTLGLVHERLNDC